MSKEDTCKQCKGEGLSEVKENEKVSVDVGTPDGHTQKYIGKGNEIPDAIAGDLYVKINIKPHKVFTRKGADLYIDKEITLKQALCGKLFVWRVLTT
jgi:molecular chaperone DnaJ